MATMSAVDRQFERETSAGARNEASSTLLEWYNGSIRSSSRSLFTLLRSSTDDLAPRSWLFSEDDRISIVEPSAMRGTGRLRRSAMLRHLLWDADSPPDGNVFDFLVDDREDYSGLSLVKLHTLASIIRSCGRHGSAEVVTLGELTATMRSVGMFDENRLMAAVRDMAVPRGDENQGFVLLMDEREIFDYIPPESRIMPLPAGRFMMEQMIPSCEFLFWSALAHPSGVSFLPGRNGSRSRLRPDAELILNEDYRIAVAVAFSLNSVLPTFVDMLHDLAVDGTIERYVETMDLMDLPGRIVASLDAFVRRSRVLNESPFERQIHRDLERLRADLLRYEDSWVSNG